jgi:hypothetical protein
VAKSSVQPGAVIDGFTIGECIHRGGMATLWSVTHSGIVAPPLMKIPLMFRRRASLVWQNVK